MKKRYEIALKEYGLSENEIRVYVTLLKMGSSTVQKISQRCTLPRTTVYHVLERLNNEGIVGFIFKENVKYFQAYSPKRLRDILDEKKHYLKEAIPELNSFTNSLEPKPNSKIFEGVKGVRSILKDLLEEKEILHYGEIESLVKNLEYIFPNFISERIKKKIPIKIIGHRKKYHDKLIKNSRKEFRKFAFLPEKYDFKSNVWIYGDKVAIFHLNSEPFYGIVIEDKDFCETQRQIFELLWKLGKSV